MRGHNRVFKVRIGESEAGPDRSAGDRIGEGWKGRKAGFLFQDHEENR